MKAKPAHIQPVVFSTRNRRRQRHTIPFGVVFAIASALVAAGLGLLFILTFPQP